MSGTKSIVVIVSLVVIVMVENLVMSMRICRTQSGGIGWSAAESDYLARLVRLGNMNHSAGSTDRDARIVRGAMPSDLVSTTHSRSPSSLRAIAIIEREIKDLEGAACNS